jgi:hypothetical protein
VPFVTSQGKARQGKARQGKARQGKARQGKARQGTHLDCEVVEDEFRANDPFNRLEDGVDCAHADGSVRVLLAVGVAH